METSTPSSRLSSSAAPSRLAKLTSLLPARMRERLDPYLEALALLAGRGSSADSKLSPPQQTHRPNSTQTNSITIHLFIGCSPGWLFLELRLIFKLQIHFRFTRNGSRWYFPTFCL